MRPAPFLLGAGAAAAACVAYGAGIEVRSFRLRRVQAAVLPPGQRPLRVLHLSDLHLRPGQRRKREWVRRLAGLEPDLVVDTGDNLAHPRAVPYVLDALGPLLDLPGAFVLGSNDYWAPRPRNPARYLLPDDRQRNTQRPLPWTDLRDGLVASGWCDLDNRRARVTVDARELDLAGLDDPHLGLDRHDKLRGPADPSADLSIAVLHAPYRRVLDVLHRDGYPLLLAGHTHGGQLRVPGYGALVTNCDLPRDQARGLSRWPPPSVPASRRSFLHVSAGLGTSPYAPVRFACPPEATLLTLVARG